MATLDKFYKEETYFIYKKKNFQKEERMIIKIDYSLHKRIHQDIEDLYYKFLEEDRY